MTVEMTQKFFIQKKMRNIINITNYPSRKTTLARHLRFRQTRAAIKHHEIKLKHTIKELNIDTLGPRFLPRLTVIQNEKKAASLKILIHFMIYRMICNKI